MKECLRLVYERKSSKEIALLLSTADQSLSENTVSGYIAEAVRLIGARNRKEAAERLHEFETDGPQKPSPEELRVAAANDEEVIGPSLNGHRPLGLPLRGKGDIGNELGTRQRLFWIFVLTIGAALGVGAVANVLRFIDDLVIARR